MTEERRKAIKEAAKMISNIGVKTLTVASICVLCEFVDAAARREESKIQTIIDKEFTNTVENHIDFIKPELVSAKRNNEYNKKEWKELRYYNDYFTGYSMDQAFDAYNESKHSEEWD